MKAKECIYCGTELNDSNITKDHVPPKCLFSKPYPKNFITVPSCKECNTNYGLDDEYFKEKIIVNIENTHPNRDDYFKSILRSLDRQEAAGYRKRFKNELRVLQIVDSSGLPYVRLMHDKKRIDRFLQRCVRALIYDHGKKLSNQIIGYHELENCQIIQLEAVKKLDLRGLQPSYNIGNVFCAWFYAEEPKSVLIVVMRFFELDFVYNIYFPSVY